MAQISVSLSKRGWKAPHKGETYKRSVFPRAGYMGNRSTIRRNMILFQHGNHMCKKFLAHSYNFKQNVTWEVTQAYFSKKYIEMF